MVMQMLDARAFNKRKNAIILHKAHIWFLTYIMHAMKRIEQTQKRIQYIPYEHGQIAANNTKICTPGICFFFRSNRKKPSCVVFSCHFSFSPAIQSIHFSTLCVWYCISICTLCVCVCVYCVDDTLPEWPSGNIVSAFRQCFYILGTISAWPIACTMFPILFSHVRLCVHIFFVCSVFFFFFIYSF